MPDVTSPASSLPVSLSNLIGVGFREDTAEAAALEIADLVEAIFGPLDPAVADGWALLGAQALDPAAMRQILGEAAEAEDPLATVKHHKEARAMLVRHLQPRWSSPRGRVLGHPPGLQGQTWAFLSERARDEVREALRHLRGFWASQIRRNRPKRDDLDTFLRELAEIFVIHLGQQRDRRGRAARRLLHWTDVPHSPTSRFIRLAVMVLAGLPPLATGKHRIALTEYTARGLSERWKRIKEREAEVEESDDRNAPPL